MTCLDLSLDLKRIENIASTLGNCSFLIENLLNQNPSLEIPQTAILEVMCELLEMQSIELANIFTDLEKEMIGKKMN